MAYYLQRGAVPNKQRTIQSTVDVSALNSCPPEWRRLAGEDLRFWGVGKTHSKPSAGDVGIFTETSEGQLVITDVAEILDDARELPELAAALGWDRHESFPFVFPLRPLWHGSETVTDPGERTAFSFLPGGRSWIRASEDATPILDGLTARILGGDGPPPPPPSNGETELIAIHLVAGKNVILVGPPGSGKTTVAIRLCEQRFKVAFDLETGSPEWTPFDVVGGVDLKGEFRKGFLTRTLLKCVRSLRTEGKPHWLIMDELNRANMDLAFAHAFTLLDIPHRKREFLLGPEELTWLPESDRSSLDGMEGLPVPLSFRILGTMNSYDRSLLFRLGYALSRRFALVPWSSQVAGLSAGEFDLTEVRRHVPGSLEKLLSQSQEELALGTPELNDYALVDESLAGRVEDAAAIIQTPSSTLGNMAPLDVATGFLGFLNARLETFSGEAIRVEIASQVDVVRYLLAAALLGIQANRVRVLDEAIAAYVMPQLDVLGKYARAERLGLGPRGERSLEDLFAELRDATKQAGFHARTLPMVERLASGQPLI